MFFRVYCPVVVIFLRDKILAMRKVFCVLLVCFITSANADENPFFNGYDNQIVFNVFNTLFCCQVFLSINLTVQRYGHKKTCANQGCTGYKMVYLTI